MNIEPGDIEYEEAPEGAGGAYRFVVRGCQHQLGEHRSLHQAEACAVAIRRRVKREGLDGAPAV